MGIVFMKQCVQRILPQHPLPGKCREQASDCAVSALALAGRLCDGAAQGKEIVFVKNCALRNFSQKQSPSSERRRREQARVLQIRHTQK
jgi:hypothetical protein